MIKEQFIERHLDELYRREEHPWLRTDAKNSPNPVQKMGDLCQNPDQYMDETALILSAQHGDLDSFNCIVLTYQDLLFNSALHILGDNELAGDVTQDAFISAFRHINNYRGGSFKAWLMRTVTNGCYDELRRQKRHLTVPLEPSNADDDEMETPRWLADLSMSPEEKLVAAELEHLIFHCLNALPIDFRTVVVLVDIQGMEYSQVASATRVPLGTVKSRLARGRLHLRKSLQEFCELLPAAYRLEKKSHP